MVNDNNTLKVVRARINDYKIASKLLRACLYSFFFQERSRLGNVNYRKISAC